MRRAFLIGGLNINHTVIADDYLELREGIASKGYEVMPADISWRRTTPSLFAEKFKKFYIANKSPDGNLVIGNSFGAVVALITAAELKPDLLVLCSVSPFFKEDFERDNWPQPDHLRRLGKRRIEDIGQYSVAAVAKSINEQGTEVKILFGELEKEELPVLVDRARDLAAHMPGAELIEVPGAPHRFRMPEYVAGIIKAI